MVQIMQIFVGSTNPVKVNSTAIAASETWPEAKVKGLEVASGIAAQPMSDEETQQGSKNRAVAVLELAKKMLLAEGSIDDLKNNLLGVGLEGGVFLKGDELWSTVWATVVDVEGNVFQSNGARFKVPQLIAQKILTGGEMGPVVSQITGKDDIKQKSGAIGIVTNNFIDRTEEYTGIIKLALGLWYGRNWEKKLTPKII